MARIKAAGLFLVNKDNKILVGHPTNHDPNFWSIPKGKIDEGETPLQAAIRETYEESNVKLFQDLHDFVELGKQVYKHKKKEITLFAHFETDSARWDERLNIACNSNVPEERGGFPEMDAFKWVTLDEAEDILHDTQVKMLDKLDDVITEHRADKIWCVDCKEVTPHRKKLSAVRSGHQVCGVCARMNPVCILTKEGEDWFQKTSNKVLFLTFKEDRTFEEAFEEPAVGRGLLMSPFNDAFTWQTTPIQEIIEQDLDGHRKYVKFRTENSVYELNYHKL